MEFIENKMIPGVFEIRLEPHRDNRGFFMRTYDEELFRVHDLHRRWLQENHSRSEKRGIIRGLHFQLPPFAETKLVRCVRGAVFDVFVDLREDSATFGKWGGIALREDKYNMVYIPRGFAHGFCALTEESEVVYKVDNVYSQKNERGLLWNDPDLDISWPSSNPILSEKDAKNLTLKEFVARDKYIDTMEHK